MTNRIAASRAKSIFHSKISHVSDFSLLNPKKVYRRETSKIKCPTHTLNHKKKSGVGEQNEIDNTD